MPVWFALSPHVKLQLWAYSPRVLRTPMPARVHFPVSNIENQIPPQNICGWHREQGGSTQFHCFHPSLDIFHPHSPQFSSGGSSICFSTIVPTHNMQWMVWSDDCEYKDTGTKWTAMESGAGASLLHMMGKSTADKQLLLYCIDTHHRILELQHLNIIFYMMALVCAWCFVPWQSCSTAKRCVLAQNQFFHVDVWCTSCQIFDAMIFTTTAVTSGCSQSSLHTKYADVDWHRLLTSWLGPWGSVQVWVISF